MVGSKLFMAPEILEGICHGTPCDIWSVGIIIYLMISGFYPFGFRNIDNEIMNTPVLFLHNSDKFSSTARDLIRGLLEKSQYARLTAS
jgi:serine/threonine protein kinase